MAILAGCATPPLDPGLTGPFYQIGNFYLVDRQLPIDIRRVAMLPMAPARHDPTTRFGSESLTPILYGELAKARLFELLPVSADQMEHWTGRPRWSQDEELPANFLGQIREKTGCDAILFSQLTFYRPYPPVAVGWRLLMVRAEDGMAIWSVDEIFDAGEPRVMNSARRYALENERRRAELTREAGTKYGAAFQTRVTGMEWIHSPQQFARYAASATVETLTLK